MKKLITVLSGLVPYKPNFVSLASQIAASRNNVEEYLVYMEKAGMLSILRDGTGGLGMLGKIEKVYLDNTNIVNLLSDDKAETGTIRETFFLNQMRVNNNVTSSAVSDFEIDGKTFEVGGRSKGQKQIRDAKEGYIVKDDIEIGYGNVIPIWAFRLNY